MAEHSKNERPKRDPLDRLLGMFSDVRAGESGMVLLMSCSISLLLFGYYILKTVREPLVMATGGAEMKSYATAAQALVMMGFVPLYSWFAGRVNRKRLIIGVVIFFIVNIELFYVGSLFRVPNLGFVFYVWVGIFSLAMIAQFWSFANDMYPEEAGKRLFPVIMIGAAAGPTLGSKIAKLLFDAGVSPYSMMQITVGILMLHLAITLVAEKRGNVPAGKTQAKKEDDSLEGSNGFALVLRNPYIRLIALVMVLLNLVNTTGEYILSKTVQQAANAVVVEIAFEIADEAADEVIHEAAVKAAVKAVNEAAFKVDDETSVRATSEAVVEAIHIAHVFDNHQFDEAFKEAFTQGFVGKRWKAFIGSFYGDFFFYVNIVTLLIQAFAVSRIVKYLGMKGVLFALPLVAFGAYGVIAFGAALGLIRVLKTAENSTDYSVMNTAKALIFLPTSREEKYKAKQAVDTFFVRTGDLLSGGLVFVGTVLFQFGIKHFAIANLFLVALWVFITYLLWKEYRKISETESVTVQVGEAL